MKTFKYVSMALTAIAMGACFTACSEDEDDNGKGSGNTGKEKKLVEMVITEEGYTDHYTIHYTDGKMTSIISNWIPETGEEESETTDFIWQATTIIEKFGDDDENIKYILNDDGLIKTAYDGEATSTLKYNSAKQLVSVSNKEGDSEEYIWEGNKLTAIGDSRIVYSGQTCKGYLPMIFTIDVLASHYDSFFGIGHPELLGLRTNQLPSKWIYDDTIEERYSYTFDKDGYIKTCEVTDVYTDNRQERTHSYTMTLKWE